MLVYLKEIVTQTKTKQNSKNKILVKYFKSLKFPEVPKR